MKRFELPTGITAEDSFYKGGTPALQSILSRACFQGEWPPFIDRALGDMYNALMPPGICWGILVERLNRQAEFENLFDED